MRLASKRDARRAPGLAAGYEQVEKDVYNRRIAGGGIFGETGD
jgi:hypothetical protein